MLSAGVEVGGFDILIRPENEAASKSIVLSSLGLRPGYPLPSPANTC